MIEQAKNVLVVLDGAPLSGLGVAERCFSSRVAHRPVPAQALLEHPEQHRNLAVSIVEDPDLTLCGIQPVQPPVYWTSVPFHRDR